MELGGIAGVVVSNTRTLATGLQSANVMKQLSRLNRRNWKLALNQVRFLNIFTIFYDNSL